MLAELPVEVPPRSAPISRRSRRYDSKEGSEVDQKKFSRELKLVSQNRQTRSAGV